MKVCFLRIVFPLFVCLFGLIITGLTKAQTPTDTESAQQEQLKPRPESFRTPVTPTIEIESKIDSAPQRLETDQEGTVHREYSETSSAESSDTPAPAIPSQSGDTPDAQVEGVTLTHRDEPDKATLRTRNLHGSGSSTAQNTTPAKVEPTKTASAEKAATPSSSQTQTTARTVPWLELAIISAIGLIALHPIVWIVSSLVGIALGMIALFFGEGTWLNTLPIILGLSYVCSAYPFLRVMVREAPIGIIAFGSLLGIPAGLFALLFFEMGWLAVAMWGLAAAYLVPKAILRIFIETGLFKIERQRSPAKYDFSNREPSAWSKQSTELHDILAQTEKNPIRSATPRSSASSPIQGR